MLRCLPLTHFRVLTSRRHRVISWKECLTLGDSIGIEERDLMSAITFLKDVGTIVFFMNSGASNPEFVITDPSWLADVMSSVITFRHNWIKDGIFFESDYPHVWEEHPPEVAHPSAPTVAFDVTLAGDLSICFEFSSLVLTPLAALRDFRVFIAAV